MAETLVDYGAYSCRVRITIHGADKFFGPGICRLLTLVQDTGSLRSACASMGMAYSKAWRILKTAEEELGAPLLLGKSGGVGGGNSELSPAGRELLLRYRALCKDADEAVEALYQKHFGAQSRKA